MQRYQRVIAQLRKSSFVKHNQLLVRNFSSDKTDDGETESNSEVIENKQVELSGFAKSFEKFAKPGVVELKKVATFAHLLRHSKFIDVSTL